MTSKETQGPVPMSDAARINEYAETGNPEYLNPAVARRMGVGPDVMREVTGASDEDISFARAQQEKNDELQGRQDDESRAQHGIDSVGLEPLSAEERIQRRFDVASLRRADMHDDETEWTKDLALYDLYEETRSVEGSVYGLFDSIRYSTHESLKDLEVIQQLYGLAHHDFILLSHTPHLSEEDKTRAHNAAQMLNEFVAASNGILEGTNVLEDSNYLFIESLRDFAYRVSVSETAQHNVGYIPFEITEGIYASFTEDGDRLYVAEADTSKKMASLLSADDIAVYKRGQYFARHTALDISEEIIEAHFQILNEGTPIDKMDIGLLSSDPDLLHDYLTILRSEVRSVIESDFNVNLKELSIREQIYFTSFLKDVRVFEAKMIQDFTSNYGSLGMKTFLSLEQLGTTYAWAIVGNTTLIGGTEYKKIIEKVFTGFVDMEHASHDAETYLSKNFNSRDTAVVREVVLDIRKRAAELLQTLMSKQLTDPSFNDDFVDSVIAHANRDNALFISAFKTLKNRGELNPAEIKDTTFESVASSDITEPDKARMHEILTGNYGSKTGEFSKKISDSLSEALEGSQSTFYLLRHNGTIIGFNRFDDHVNGDNPGIYFGSFNTDPAYGNGKLGEVLYEESLKQQTERGSPIYAHCDPASPITQKYIESGFVATGLEDYAGVPSFSISLDSTANAEYETKGWKPEQIVRAALTQDTDDIRAYGAKKPEEIPFDLVNKGYALTRYLKQGDRLYAVFERSTPEEKGAA